MLLDFFLQNQVKISTTEEQIISIEKARSKCQEFLSSQEQNSSFSHFMRDCSDFKKVPHFISDTEYQPIFGKNYQDISVQSAFQNDVFAIWTCAWNENWKEYLSCKTSSQISIRTGFFQQEWDIYASLLMGFQALTIYTTGLDHFQIQYLTEVGRDYGMAILFVVHNEIELRVVLETDAPYILVSSLHPKNFSHNPQPLIQLSPHIPKTMKAFLLGQTQHLSETTQLEEFGYKGILLPCY